MRRFRRKLVLIIAGAAGCGLIGVWIGCGSRSNAVLAAGPDNALNDALALAQGAIQAPGNRLPQFLTWSTRRGIGNCTNPPEISANRARLRGTADPRLHNFRQAGGAVPPPGTTTDFGSLGFYYDDLTRKRLCQPAVKVSGTTAPSPVIMSGGVGQWWKNSAMPIDSIDTFPVGARAGAAIWTKIRRPATPTVQNLQFSVRRGGSRASLPVALNISRDLLLRGTAGKAPVCDQPLAMPGPATSPANPNALQLSSFYWVQIQTGDLVDQAGCGDLLVLTGFHLIQKTVHGWLWSTYWWDPQSTEFKHLTGVKGAGDTPSAWQNYAMDAAYGPGAVLFNPWKDTETNISNCEFCHVHAVFPAGPQPAGTAPPGSVALPAHVLRFDFIYGAALAQSP